VVQVLRSVYENMLAHVQEQPTSESCGLLAGKNGVITRIFRAENVAENPVTRYEIDPLEVMRILHEIEADGAEHLGIYHSHPRSPAYPSATDRKLAAYDVVYFVVSLSDTAAGPRAEAFRLFKNQPDDDDARVTPEPIELV
jgi:proteasome lid subunit RPN8/RPN11